MLRAVPLSRLLVDPVLIEEDQLLRHETVQLLRAHLAQLPAREREAIEAQQGISGESCRSLAKRYRTCPQTICNWANTAATKLRTALEEYR